MTNDLKTNYDAETNNSDVEKIKNPVSRTYDEANNIQLHKEDTQRSNLNSKYLSVTLILILLFVFVAFNKLTCKVQFDIRAYNFDVIDIHVI